MRTGPEPSTSVHARKRPYYPGLLAALTVPRNPNVHKRTMVSSLFSRRPRIQPLPKVCKAAPSHSCYEPPTDFPDPVSIQIYYWEPRDEPPFEFTWTVHGDLWRDFDFFWPIYLTTSAGGILTEHFEYAPAANEGRLLLSTTGHSGIPPDWEHSFPLVVPPFPWSWADTFEGEGGELSYFTIEMAG